MDTGNARIFVEIECMRCAFVDKCPVEYNCPCKELVLAAINKQENEE